MTHASFLLDQFFQSPYRMEYINRENAENIARLDAYLNLLSEHGVIRCFGYTTQVTINFETSAQTPVVASGTLYIDFPYNVGFNGRPNIHLLGLGNNAIARIFRTIFIEGNIEDHNHLIPEAQTWIHKGEVTRGPELKFLTILEKVLATPYKEVNELADKILAKYVREEPTKRTPKAKATPKGKSGGVSTIPSKPTKLNELQEAFRKQETEKKKSEHIPKETIDRLLEDVLKGVSVEEVISPFEKKSQWYLSRRLRRDAERYHEQNRVTLNVEPVEELPPYLGPTFVE